MKISLTRAAALAVQALSCVLIAGCGGATGDTSAPSVAGSPQSVEPATAPSESRALVQQVTTTTDAATATSASGPAGLVVGLAFDEGTGLVAADYSGSGQRAKLQNAAAWSTGRYGNALSLDGVSAQAALALPSALNFGNANFSLALWFKRAQIGVGRQQHLVSKCDPAAWVSGCKELYFAGDRLRFGSFSSGDTNSVSVADTNWHHLALVYNRSTSTVQIYLDGVLQTTAAKSLEADVAAHVVTLGNQGGKNAFAGLLDDVRVYSEVLDASQVLQVMNSQLVPVVDTTPPALGNVAPTGTLASGTTEVTMSLTSAENAKCRYSTVAGKTYAEMTTPFTITSGRTHSTLLTGLASGKSYTYYVRCRDMSANFNASDLVVAFAVAPGGVPAAVPAPAPAPAPAPSTAPAAIANLAVGQWLQLPNTKIRSVVPSPAPTGDPYYVVGAWSGGAVDSKRSRLLVWGGGHNDYWGNEMYALDLPTMSIQRVVEPGQTSASSCSASLPDGTPTSRHTYDGLTYIAHADRFFATTGSLSPCGSGADDTWTYDFTNRRWQFMGGRASRTLEVYGTMAEYDPVSQQVFVKDTLNFYSYSFETNKYTKLNAADQLIPYSLSGTIDTKRRKFVMVGSGGVRLVDLATGVMSTMSTTNTPALASGGYAPGVAYDPIADRIVAWNGGSSVYALNMDTGAWTQVATGAGPTSSPMSTGTNGRWGYIPAYRVFVLINSIDENAWVFRLTN